MHQVAVESQDNPEVVSPMSLVVNISVQCSILSSSAWDIRQLPTLSSFSKNISSKRGIYNLDTWNDKHSLPYGIAAFTAWGCSIIMAVTGMSQWYVGHIELLADGTPYAADIRFELTYLEMKLGR